MTTTKTARCRVNGKTIEVGRIHSGSYQAGIDGWLVATTMTPTSILHEIGERLRLSAYERKQFTLPKRFRDRVHAL